MRQSTPDILNGLAASAPIFDLAAAMTAAPVAPALRYDYAALGAAGEDIRRHALAIKAAERRTAEATVEAGTHLIAVKETIPHGHWLTWLADEFGMSDDAAQRMMGIARRFGSNTATLRFFSPSVLGLLAAPSVPDAAIDAAIAAAEVSPITVTAAKAIIASHRPARCRKCGRVLTDPAAAAQGIGACCAAKLARGAAAAEAKEEDRPLPAWATEPSAIANTTPAPTAAPPQGDSGANEETHADPRAATLARLAARLEGLREEVRQLGDEYGRVTGDFTTPLEIRHKLEKMQVQIKVNQGGWE